MNECLLPILEEYSEVQLLVDVFVLACLDSLSGVVSNTREKVAMRLMSIFSLSN